jgi:predicted alpha/beta hydrolase family esterase
MKQLARRSPADLMRASEADILIIPGFRGSDPEHWQSRWEAKLPSARRVLQENWERPKLAAWRGRIVEEVARAGQPVILIAHSLGDPGNRFWLLRRKAESLENNYQIPSCRALRQAF